MSYFEFHTYFNEWLHSLIVNDFLLRIENGAFGSSVSIYDQTFVVGSPGAISSGMWVAFYFIFGMLPCSPLCCVHLDNITGGAAYVYNIDSNSNINLVQNLTNEKLGSGDKFGFSLSINGMYIVAGAPENDGDEANIGATFIFQKGVESDDDFSLVYDLVSPTPAISAQFGWSVDVNLNGVVAVGAKGDRTAVGSVYIFKLADSIWEHVFTLEPDVVASFPNLGNAGWSVAIDNE